MKISLMNTENLIKKLNKEQRAAVMNTEGPNNCRCWIRQNKSPYNKANSYFNRKWWPNQILCVTFTNKAAKEMQNRVMHYFAGGSNSVPWLAHSTHKC